MNRLSSVLNVLNYGVMPSARFCDDNNGGYLYNPVLFSPCTLLTVLCAGVRCRSGTPKSPFRAPSCCRECPGLTGCSASYRSASTPKCWTRQVPTLPPKPNITTEGVNRAKKNLWEMMLYVVLVFRAKLEGDQHIISRV